jgi:hypothetical protein
VARVLAGERSIEEDKEQGLHVGLVAFIKVLSAALVDTAVLPVQHQQMHCVWRRINNIDVLA